MTTINTKLNLIAYAQLKTPILDEYPIPCLDGQIVAVEARRGKPGWHHQKIVIQDYAGDKLTIYLNNLAREFDSSFIGYHIKFLAKVYEIGGITKIAGIAIRRPLNHFRHLDPNPFHAVITNSASLLFEAAPEEPKASPATPPTTPSNFFSTENAIEFIHLACPHLSKDSIQVLLKTVPILVIFDTECDRAPRTVGVSTSDMLALIRTNVTPIDYFEEAEDLSAATGDVTDSMEKWINQEAPVR